MGKSTFAFVLLFSLFVSFLSPASEIWSQTDFTRYPIRTYCDSLEMQYQGVRPSAIQGEILNAARKFEPSLTFASYAAMESKMPLADQQKLVEQLIRSASSVSLEKLNLFSEPMSPLDLWYELLKKRADPSGENREPAMELIDYFNHTRDVRKEEAYTSFDDIQKRVPDDELIALLQDSGLQGNELTLARSQMSAKHYLELVRQRLESRIKGQPEAIDALMALEQERLFYGSNRERPVNMVLMGLPGTGKDTIAQSYVDAIYGYEGAWEKHMFSVPVIKNSADLWGLLGSTTGYVGSSTMPEFIKWLVKHSGGKYKLIPYEAEKGETQYAVKRNPEWKPGMVLAGYEAPEDSVIFVNELHDWSKNMINRFLKQAVERGYFEINNPGPGLHRITVPATFLIATNAGINLIAARERNGQRYGRPLTYEQMLKRWQKAEGHEDILKGELAALNGSANAPSTNDEASGISEEMLSRLNNLLLLRPLSKDVMRSILLAKLHALETKIRRAAGFKDVQLIPSAELVDLLLNYEYSAESSARNFDNKLKKMVEVPLIEAAVSGKLRLKRGDKIYLGVAQRPDQTYDLLISKSSFAKPLRKHIVFTDQNRKRDKISNIEIAAIKSLPQRMKKRVVNVDPLLEKIAVRILDAENRRRAKVTVETATEPAQSYLFLGPSSTGKNETVKALAQEFFHDPSAYVLIDFSRVQTKRDLEELILGTRDGHGDGMPSPFMKAYDRLHGRGIIVLDEIANAPRDVLKALYDILREPVVTTFSDGKERIMSNLIIVGTGNAGEEWYKDIPRNVPEEEQMEAMHQIYQEAMKDEGFQRKFLEQYFSSALITRIGQNNIFFFSPFNAKSVRELTQIKLMSALKDLAPADGKRGWKVSFADRQEFINLVEAIEQNGFRVWEQGASLDHYIREDFAKNLSGLLLSHHIPDGADVTLHRAPANASEKEVDFVVSTARGPLILKLPTKKPQIAEKISTVNRILVAYHEAGHEIVRHILFGDVTKSEGITIMPGVTEIGGRWIRYLGLAKHESTGYVEKTRQAVIYEMAKLAGGYVAQTMVTKGARHDMGKNNDMERASWLATVAILRGGLSPKWGTAGIPTGMSIEDYIAGLSPKRRVQFERERDKMVKEAEAVARDVLTLNFHELLVPMATELAHRGEMTAKGLARFYLAHPGEVGRNSAEFVQAETRDAELIPDLPRPISVADPDVIRAKNRKRAQDGVKIPDNIPIGSLPSIATQKNSRRRSCPGVF